MIQRHNIHCDYRSTIKMTCLIKINLIYFFVLFTEKLFLYGVGTIKLDPTPTLLGQCLSLTLLMRFFFALFGPLGFLSRISVYRYIYLCTGLVILLQLFIKSLGYYLLFYLQFFACIHWIISFFKKFTCTW